MNTEPNTNPLMVGLSGGVDSAVAALLLARQGQPVEALFMKNWEEDDDDAYCSAEQDLADARQVAEQLGLTLHLRNFSHEYWERVFSLFLAEYRAGRTPNPDILCNKEIKFRAFLDHARELGCRGIATGHYARIIEGRDGPELHKAMDTHKDQSYFLHLLDRQQLAHSAFPLGELPKPRVRELARQAGLANHARKDSTGICFIGERPFREFLQRYLPAQPGEIHDADGRPLGRHQGLMYYTLGQRQGLGIGGRAGGDGRPWYVIGKDLRANILKVAQGHDHPHLYSRGLRSGPMHWIAGRPPHNTDGLSAKTRYRQADQACRITSLSDENMELQFSEPQWAVTPGQSAVLYQGSHCLGGAVIGSTQA